MIKNNPVLQARARFAAKPTILVFLISYLTSCEISVEYYLDRPGTAESEIDLRCSIRTLSYLAVLGYATWLVVPGHALAQNSNFWGGSGRKGKQLSAKAICTATPSIRRMEELCGRRMTRCKRGSTQEKMTEYRSTDKRRAQILKMVRSSSGGSLSRFPLPPQAYLLRVNVAPELPTDCIKTEESTPVPGHFLPRQLVPKGFLETDTDATPRPPRALVHTAATGDMLPSPYASHGAGLSVSPPSDDTHPARRRLPHDRGGHEVSRADDAGVTFPVSIGTRQGQTRLEMDVEVPPPKGEVDVAVRNLGFEKQVAVRFTFDDWETTSEVTARYAHSRGNALQEFQGRSLR
ncbi:hypothetical protein B0H13DRAFT_1850583 [Mycena leptocephala]|nr:hypothetical protein B0H13DRAFT_1850583 [Mycena leptocephala]